MSWSLFCKYPQSSIKECNSRFISGGMQAMQKSSWVPSGFPGTTFHWRTWGAVEKRLMPGLRKCQMNTEHHAAQKSSKAGSPHDKDAPQERARPPGQCEQRGNGLDTRHTRRQKGDGSGRRAAGNHQLTELVVTPDSAQHGKQASAEARPPLFPSIQVTGARGQRRRRG